MKPSELIQVLQQAVDAGRDDTTPIYFDTEAKVFHYHMAKVGKAYFEPHPLGGSMITLYEG